VALSCAWACTAIEACCCRPVGSASAQLCIHVRCTGRHPTRRHRRHPNPPKHVTAHRVEAIIDTVGGPSAGVLLAAHGVGAAVCEETPVARGDTHCWSVLQQQKSPGPIYIGSAGAAQVRFGRLGGRGGRELGRGWQALLWQRWGERAGDRCCFTSPGQAGPQQTVAGGRLLAGSSSL